MSSVQIEAVSSNSVQLTLYLVSRVAEDLQEEGLGVPFAICGGDGASEHVC